ncbi:MAG: transketolase [Candidatus Cloacimonetes bacterium]|nr:transketolase [Candidatus Cloacimonadota bacterium]
MDTQKGRLTSVNLEEIRKLTMLARAAILKMTTLAGSGHPGGSMSTIDYLLVLLHLAKLDPQNPDWKLRDRIIISHGHVSPAVYAALGLRGYFPLDDAIAQFRLAGSIFEGHVEPEVPGVEWASGNLGQGLSAACGIALACRLQKIWNHIFVLMGDGEQQKGQLSEARRFAIKYGLKNIVAFCDHNGLQIGGSISTIMPQNIKDDYQADGWQVISINGHELSEIQEAIFTASRADKPSLILAETVMGKGVSFMENKEQYHGSALSEEQLASALQELGIDNDLPRYKELRQAFFPLTEKTRNSQDIRINTGKPHIYQERTDNRSAWGNALCDISQINPHLSVAVFDCDLQVSVKTLEFERLFPQRFFECGIMEHHAAVTAGAMSRENIQVFFADFGVFGVDETYNQHRLNDINNTNLKIITTHVGLDVGEDGKTHQCIDYLGVMRNLFNFRIIIPADPNQTDRAIRYLAGKKGNYLVAMGRSKTDIIHSSAGKVFFDEDYQFTYGEADLLREGNQVAIFTMGNLVSYALKISDLLESRGLRTQVWNISTPLQIDEQVIFKAAATGFVFSYEDHNINTGLGSLLAEKLVHLGLSCHFHKFGVRNYAVSGKAKDVYKYCSLDPESVTAKIISIIEKPGVRSY